MTDLLWLIAGEIWVFGYLIAWAAAPKPDRWVVHLVCLGPIALAVVTGAMFYFKSLSTPPTRPFPAVTDQMVKPH